MLASAKKAQAYPWLHDWDEEAKPLSVDVTKNLATFHEYGAMKKVVCEVLAFTLIPEQLKNLREEFLKIDVHNTGEFTKEAFIDAIKKSDHISEKECAVIFNVMDVGGAHWQDPLARVLGHYFVQVRVRREKHEAIERLDIEHHRLVTTTDMGDIHREGHAGISS